MLKRPSRKMREALLATLLLVWRTLELLFAIDTPPFK
nr:MAG TPA: hypothetical protein [Caudoviricetes sp.]